MKTCSYCGRECSDDAITCAGCGTEFVGAREDTPGGPFGRPPRPEASSIVLKTFSQEPPAQQAVAALRAARIEAFVAIDDCGGLYPPLSGSGNFRLMVSEVHREAAGQVLADLEVKAGSVSGYVADPNATGPLDSSTPTPQSSPARSLGAAILGMVVGVLVVLGYQGAQEKFSGTDRRDFDRDGRTDSWDTYDNGRISKVGYDQNGDEQPDYWTYYEGDVSTRWEEDCNFDGIVDVWGTFDNRGVANQSKVDLDFDGKADLTHFFQSGLIKETHFILPLLTGSTLVWKKEFYTNGIFREELLDRNRDGKFDEKLFYDVFGVEVSREKLN